MIKAAVFDFDGVFVLDSDAIFKRDAWGVALSAFDRTEWEPLLREANSIFGHGKPGGRKEILEHVFRGLGKDEGDIEQLVANASALFDAHVQTEIKKAGLVPGAREMLEQLKTREIVCFLNSGTATSALIRSAENLGIAGYFDGIYGSTKEMTDTGTELPGGGKIENLERVEKAGFSRVEIIVIGDGVSDLEAAKKFGCRFLGIANKWNRWDESRLDFEYVQNLTMVSDKVLSPKTT
jgi:phosphoglycolate phosphatase-like HAD superfamily hydrolase